MVITPAAPSMCSPCQDTSPNGVPSSNPPWFSAQIHLHNHTKQHLSKNLRFFLPRNFHEHMTQSKQHSADTQRKFIYTINTSRIKLSDFAIRIRMKLRFEDLSSFSKFWNCFLQSFQNHHRCLRIPDFDVRQRSASHQ